jgi:hypothetical protein
MNDRRRSVVRVVPAVALGALVASALPVRAQNTPGGTVHDNSGLNGSWSRADLEKMNGLKQNPAPDPAQNTPEARAKVQSQGVELLQKLHVDCESPEVTLVVAGTSRSALSGKTLDAKVYEAACRSGLGYLFETRGADAPLVISCLSAEAGRISDQEKGRPSGFYCRLPQNRDVKATAATLLAGAGTQCAVREWRWYGKSLSSQSEYSEVACDDGLGFVLRTPMPGSQAATVAIGCADAARQGITCHLTAVAQIPPAVTLDTFRGALAKQGVTCKLDQIREVGQEDVHKRYVVEYLCAKELAAKVALIPLASNTNPFEVLSCAAAAGLGVECTLAPHR